MAQLKDLLVSGVSRFVGKLFADEVQLTTLNIPTQSNGSTYGPGDSNGKNVLRSNGTSVYWGNLTIGDVSSGILPVTQGGTGLGTLTSGQALIGNGTGNVTFRAITNNTSATAVTASTNLITANTLYYHKGNSNLTTVGTISSGTWQGSTIGVKYGGTGHTDNWVQYGVVYASATNALTNTAAGTSGQLLKSNATSAPSWVSQADITAGKANALTNLTTADAASSTATQRYVWISYDNNTTGRPAYTSALTFQTSTGTLTATKFAGDGASLTALNASNISSGTLSADRLATSGVTAASYGPAANASPAHGASFTVPYITVDNKGRITAASTKTITLPSDNNTDVNVTQTNTTTNADYRILFSGNANDNNETTTVRKNTNLKYNPNTKNLQLTGGALTLGTSRINQAVTGTQVANGLDNGSSASPNRYTPAKWSFNLGFQPTTGDIIMIKTPGAGHDYGVFLSTDNGSHYYPITLNGTGRMTTHYPTGTYLQLAFDSANSAASVFAFDGGDSRVTVTGGTWRVLNYYDSNSTTINTLYEYYGNWVAGNNIKRYQVVFQQVGTNHNKLITLFETDNAYNTTNKTLLTTEFDPCGKIYYYNSSAAVASGNSIAASALYWKVLLDMRYTFNISSNSASGTFTGTNGKQVYLRVNINNTTGGASVDGNQPLVDVLPTTNDGKYYIYLGQMYSQYQMQLSYDHPVYYHNGKRIVEYKPIARVLDYNNSTPVEFGYSTSGMTGLTSSSWLAAWDAGTSGVYRLRAASPQTIRNAMGLGNTTGALPIANGGTAMTSNPSLLVNLASTDAATVFQASPRPGVTGTLPIAHGGTGQTTAAGIFNVVRDNGGNSTWVNVSGDTLTGALNTANNVWNKIGDDAQLGDINKAGHIGIQGLNGNTGLFFTTYNQSTKTTGGAITWDGSNFTITGTIATSISGNAATATAFSSGATVTLTGDITGQSAASTKSWSIATTLKNSGATAGSYGQSAAATLAHSGKFKVPYITVDAKGIVTSISEKEITLPASGNTDASVSQTITSADANYRVLFSGTADNTTRTEGARKDGDFLYNPSSNTLTVPTIKVGTYQGTGGGNSTIFVNDSLVTTSDYIVGSTTDKLTNSSSDSEWLKRLLVKLCDTYPNRSATFEGRISPNSVGYYKVYIYNTANRDSTTQLPQYSYGEFRKYTTNHWNFGTSNYSFFCHQIIYNSGTWGISITGSAAKLGTSDVGSTYVPIYLDDGTAKQCSSPSLQVNLASTNADTVFKQSPRPGVTGVLGATNGGTGKDNLKDACNALINALDTGSSTLTANDYVITQYVGGGTTTTTYHRRPASAIRVGGLLTGRSLKVALNSTTAVTFNGTADVNNIPVTGTLGIANGGTGQTTAAGVFSALSWTGGTSAGPTLSATVVGQTRTATIPSASASASGVITTGAQTIAGAKTLSSTLTIKGLKGTSNTDYGTALPSSGSEGQIFFQISDETYEIPAGGTTGQALIKNSNTDRDVKWGPVGGQQTPNNSVKFYPSGSTSTAANTGDAVFNTSVYVQNSVLFGAAWNDYAEYRETTTPVEAGRVVVENGDDTLSLSTKRMQPGAEIVSDTFGFAIGQTEKSKTAIAASGRVLAYPHEPRRTYKPGQPVCSGPNGTVSQMTDEEARMYPWCIIGTVSSIPEYDTWGEENIQVNGRIWIRIR